MLPQDSQSILPTSRGITQDAAAGRKFSIRFRGGPSVTLHAARARDQGAQFAPTVVDGAAFIRPAVPPFFRPAESPR